MNAKTSLMAHLMEQLGVSDSKNIKQQAIRVTLHGDKKPTIWISLIESVWHPAMLLSDADIAAVEVFRFKLIGGGCILFRQDKSGKCWTSYDNCGPSSMGQAAGIELVGFIGEIKRLSYPHTRIGEYAPMIVQMEPTTPAVK